MTDERLDDLFVAAAELDGSERRAFLDTECRADHELRRRIEARLAASERAERHLEKLATKLGLDDTSDIAFIGTTVGHYRIVRLIGRGGMGAVYLGERADEQYELEVAIKLLPLGVAGPDSANRFLAERQILARLSHPGIARLIDGGITDDGAPYIVMEYVDGEPIDRYCDRHALPLSARIELVRQVASAVDYAHRNLIVHRDLKPGNVLVTDDGTVKLLDFGIAKILDDESANYTVMGGAPMTPRYTSPEVLKGEPVSTAADVYALGILLYELLAGVGPYDDRDTATTAALLRVVLDADIKPPSVMVEQAAVGARPERSADKRKALVRRLRGDLDTIVMKALAADPAERYRSASDLDDDLRRTLAHEPISAHPPSLGYRLRKLVARHTTAVAFSVTAIAALIALTATAVYFAVTTAEQSRLVAKERDRAEEVQGFLVDLFESAEPNATRGAELTARELLDQGAARLANELGDQPAARARLQSVIGQVYVALGLYGDARPLIEQSVDFYRTTEGADAHEHSAVLDQLAELTEIEGHYDAALELAHEALATSRRAADEEGIARDTVRIGRIQHLKGNLDEAEPNYRTGLAAYRALFGDSHPAVAQCLSHLGALLEHRGELEESEALHRQSLAIKKTLFGDSNLATIESYINLGSVLSSQRKFDEALTALNRALELNTTLLGASHRDNAFIYNHRAHLWRDTGDLDAAQADFLRSLEIVEAHFGSGHPNYGIVLGNVGKLQFQTGRYAEAVETLRESFEVLAAALPEHWTPFDIERWLGEALLATGQRDAAEHHLTNSVVELTARRGEDDEATRAAMAALAKLTD